MHRIQILLLALIVFLAAILRFYQLGVNPPSLTWDEAAWGYNAYSLGITGKDEFGRVLPYDFLESFGDFKPPMYAYLTILPVKLFGLNEFATRFPSALFGALTVLITFFLVLHIFLKSTSRVYIALLSSFLLAISPWHIMLSRAAFEANVASFFLVAGVWLFILSTQKFKWYLVLSAIFFALSLYTFNTSRIVAPLLVVFLSFNFRNYLLKEKKVALVAVIVGVLLVLPIFKFLTSQQASLRFKEVNIFSDISVVERINQEVGNDHDSSISKIIHNRRITFAVEYLKHYFDNLNPIFLFVKGDGNPKFSTQAVGQMYLWELPFFIIGIGYLLKTKIGYWWIVPGWLLLGIIPAATARETPHALRIEATLPTFQIVVAFGLYIVYEKFHKYKEIMIAGASVVCAVFLFYFLYDYFKFYPKAYSHEWQYGYKDSIAYVTSVEQNYQNIYITTELGRPYIYYLFYKKFSPEVFQKTAIVHRDSFGFVNVESFGKYHFISDFSNIKDRDALYIGATSDIPESAHIKKTFYFLNDRETLKAYTL